MINETVKKQQRQLCKFYKYRDYLVGSKTTVISVLDALEQEKERLNAALEKLNSDIKDCDIDIAEINKEISESLENES